MLCHGRELHREMHPPVVGARPAATRLKRGLSALYSLSAANLMLSALGRSLTRVLDVTTDAATVDEESGGAPAGAPSPEGEPAASSSEDVAGGAVPPTTSTTFHASPDLSISTSALSSGGDASSSVDAPNMTDFTPLSPIPGSPRNSITDASSSAPRFPTPDGSPSHLRPGSMPVQTSTPPLAGARAFTRAQSSRFGRQQSMCMRRSRDSGERGYHSPDRCTDPDQAIGEPMGLVLPGDGVVRPGALSRTARQSSVSSLGSFTGSRHFLLPPPEEGGSNGGTPVSAPRPQRTSPRGSQRFNIVDAAGNQMIDSAGNQISSTEPSESECRQPPSMPPSRGLSRAASRRAPLCRESTASSFGSGRNLLLGVGGGSGRNLLMRQGTMKTLEESRPPSLVVMDRADAVAKADAAYLMRQARVCSCRHNAPPSQEQAAARAAVLAREQNCAKVRWDSLLNQVNAKKAGGSPSWRPGGANGDGGASSSGGGSDGGGGGGGGSGDGGGGGSGGGSPSNSPSWKPAALGTTSPEAPLQKPPSLGSLELPLDTTRPQDVTLIQQLDINGVPIKPEEPSVLGDTRTPMSRTIDKRWGSGALKGSSGAIGEAEAADAPGGSKCSPPVLAAARQPGLAPAHKMRAWGGGAGAGSGGGLVEPPRPSTEVDGEPAVVPPTAERMREPACGAARGARRGWNAFGTRDVAGRGSPRETRTPGAPTKATRTRRRYCKRQDQ